MPTPILADVTGNFVVYGVRMPLAWQEPLYEEARRRRIPISTLVRSAVESYLDENINTYASKHHMSRSVVVLENLPHTTACKHLNLPPVTFRAGVRVKGHYRGRATETERVQCTIDKNLYEVAEKQAQSKGKKPSEWFAVLLEAAIKNVMHSEEKARLEERLARANGLTWNELPDHKTWVLQPAVDYLPQDEGGPYYPITIRRLSEREFKVWPHDQDWKNTPSTIIAPTIAQAKALGLMMGNDLRSLLNRG